MTRPALLALLLAAGPAAGKDLDAKLLTRVSRPGAFTADVRGVAQLRVPQGFRWVSEGHLPELSREAGVTAAGTEAGAVVPDDGKWVAFVSVLPADPLAGADPKAVSPDALLTWQERHSAGRRRLGGSASATGGWTHVPAWDADKRWLTMGVRLTPGSGESGPDLVRYQVIVYVDGGPVCLEGYAPVGTGSHDYQRLPAELARLAGEVSVPKPAAEPAAEGDDSLMYYGKIAGGGLLGSVVVAVLFWPRSRNRAAARPGPGLPR